MREGEQCLNWETEKSPRKQQKEERQQQGVRMKGLGKQQRSSLHSLHL